MNRTALVNRIWIGFGAATFATALLGGLGAYAANGQSVGWSIAAVALAALSVVVIGSWIASSAGAVLGALAAEAESHAAGMERQARALDAAAGALARLGAGELPTPLSDEEAGELPRLQDAVNASIGGVARLAGDLEALLAGKSPPQDGRGGLLRDAVKALHEKDRTASAASALQARLLDAVPAAIVASDRDGRVTFANAAAEQLLGARRQDLLGKPHDRGRLAAAVGRTGGALALVATEVKGPQGERAGQVEVGLDQGTAPRQLLYASAGMKVVQKAVAQLASGALELDLELPNGEECTGETQRHLQEIVEGLGAIRGAVAATAQAAAQAVGAVAAGRLGERIEVGAHRGEFRKIVEGFNQTLEAVLAPVSEAARALEQLARRDLRARVAGTFAGDHARIQSAVNSAAEALHEALQQVAEAVEQVSSASGQIASSSQAVASGASEQAASLQETSSAIESVAGMTRQSADNAQQANHLATAARSAAGEGTAAVEQMQAAMSRIKASAEGTSQIIKDINDIAFQTNLLALNAAVEAARAGEAGRGFAVVAEEVRSLALRAKEAAQKTEELIRQSVKEAGDGEVTARQVAGRLGEIAGGISKVTDIISEIAAGAKEQATGIDHVNQAVAEMDKVTQQNAASAEESSSAASELSAQAEELAAMIGSFRLEKASAARPPAPAPRAAAARLPARAPREAKSADELFPMDQAGDLRDF